MTRAKEELLKPARNALVQCMGLREGESVLVVTNHEKQSIADALFQVAKELGADPSILLYPAGKINGEEPPKMVTEAMKVADLVLAPTVVSISHTDARRAATANGHTRIATLPGITEEIFIRGLGADYDEIAETCERIRAVLDAGKTATVTTPSGTDIEIDIDNTAVASDGNISKPGAFSNLPDGESELPKPNDADGAEQDSVQDPPTRKIIKTKKGHTIQFEDADGEEMIMIKMIKEDTIGHVITLNKDGIKITDATENIIEMKEDLFSITAKVPFTIDASGQPVEIIADTIDFTKG